MPDLTQCCSTEKYHSVSMVQQECVRLKCFECIRVLPYEYILMIYIQTVKKSHSDTHDNTI